MTWLDLTHTHTHLVCFSININTDLFDFFRLKGCLGCADPWVSHSVHTRKEQPSVKSTMLSCPLLFLHLHIKTPVYIGPSKCSKEHFPGEKAFLFSASVVYVQTSRFILSLFLFPSIYIFSRFSTLSLSMDSFHTIRVTLKLSHAYGRSQWPHWQGWNITFGTTSIESFEVTAGGAQHVALF